MGVLSLNVISNEKGIRKTMQFEPTTLVFDAAKLIRDKFAMHDTNHNEYGLFRIEEDPTKCVWMENGRTLEYYLVRNQDQIEYKKKIRHLKVRMLDGAVKTIPVDESQPVGQLMLTICNKIGISNYEEYSLVRDDILLKNGSNSTWNLREERSRSIERSGGGMMNTLGRKKEQKLEELRKKLHTDEELPWLDHQKTLREQNITEEETLLLRRKYFFSDTNVDSRDPVQLNLLYVQCRDGILRGLHPVQKETALHLAALQAHIQYGDFPYDKPKFHIQGSDVLPKEYAKNKENEKKVVQLYKELSGTNELDAKSKYVHLCRELKTYGVTFFVVKEKMPGKNKLVPRLLGVNKESVMRVDEKTKQILKEWPLEQVRRWASGPKTFNLDFGDYQDSYYSVQTTDGEKIGQLIGGYIDIILKKKRTRDHQGIEGDEGSTMLEDMVAPAKATLVAHGQIGNGQQVTDGSVAVKGVLRTPQGGYGYGINGAQYGAVSGEITTQSLAKAQRLRVRDMYEHPQRALIGTIEATIRAVDEAEVELEQEPQIDIPKFNDDLSANRWIDEQMAVNKENVNERLAAMGAATAQVVQWTAVQEEYDDRVGTAIATIGSNLPDVSRNVRDLSALMPREDRGDLVQATRLLCGAFGDFLTAVNPEQNERRNVVFTAAGRVGEFSQQVINTMDQPTDRQKQFDDHLVQKAKNVATSTAQLVLCAKTISAECDEPIVQEKVIQSATKCAFATSQLVACARVVAPTIDNQACQQQLTSAATEVSQSVTNLLHDARHATHQQSSLTDIHTAARQVTNALDSLLEHAKTSPKVTTSTQRREEEEEYNEVLRRTNRMIAHQGPSEELTREAKKVIRHSQILSEQFEHEAYQRPEDKDRLLAAAQRVATATSEMIDATRECESRPSEMDSERNLRLAAERLGKVTNETTQEQQEKHIMNRLEQAARQTAYDATQTIVAANAATDVIENQQYRENLVYDQSSMTLPLSSMVASMRESINAQDSSQKFRAQSRLIRDSHKILETSVRLVESSRIVVPSINEVHLASNLSETSNRLATSLAELRTAVNDAQQLNFSQQLIYSEQLIKELDDQLVKTQIEAQSRTLTPTTPSTTPIAATSILMSNARNVGAGVAQLISAESSRDERHVGSSAVELAQSLRDFTESVREVVAIRNDVQLEKLIISARSVVHESGNVFDKVRQHSSPLVLADTAKNVSTSLKQVIASIPDTEHIDKAVYRIQTASASPSSNVCDVRQAANRFIDATSQLVVSINQPNNSRAVDVFVDAYCDLHTSVVAHLQQSKKTDHRRRGDILNDLEATQRESITVLSTLSRGSGQQLSNETKELTTTVNHLVELIADDEQPWQQECDAALRRIQAVYHVTQSANIPLNSNSFFSSLQSVSDISHRLGEAMTGMARHAKVNDSRGFCENVRNSADALCSLAESASHSAYLVGVSHPSSRPGRAALIDTSEVARCVDAIETTGRRIESKQLRRDELLDDTSTIAKHTASLAQLCRNASELTGNVDVKKFLVNSAFDLGSKTKNLVEIVKQLNVHKTPELEENCSTSSASVRNVAQQLLNFSDKPDFGAIAAEISPQGRAAQSPILNASREMLDTSAEMIRTAKQLATSPQSAATWQRLADNSIHVSESIKRLVASIHEAAPGQHELDEAIAHLHSLIGQIERSAMDCYGRQPQIGHNSNAEKQLLQQLQQITNNLENKVDELRSAAIEHGEHLPHIVQYHAQLVNDLTNASCAVASITNNSIQQSELFDKCRTVVEAELQMMLACRESGGNPNATHAHLQVDDSGAQLKHAIGDMRSTIAKISSDHGAVQGMVDTISSSIANTDVTMTSIGSFAEAQTRMNHHLETIRRIAIQMPNDDTTSLGASSLNLSENYRLVAADVRQAVTMLTEADIGQKLKVAVQKLGTSCIEAVKVAGHRRAHPDDARIHRELTSQASTVVERVDQVLAALHEASRGTQACINAANTVSGIIGDLDTTIMFATSGSLNVAAASDEFPQHRDAILKTAKALVEDTKALVAGAASNQEQLAVAAQNAVRTIVNLSDAVKNGAVSLSSDNSEAQVLVINAVRDVAAALSSLIQATKNASGRSLQHPAMGQLKDAAKVMVSNVTCLLKTVRSVEQKEQQGARALEAAVEAVTYEINHYDIESNEAASYHQHDIGADLQYATDGIANVTQRLATTVDNLNAEEEVIAVANLSRTAVRTLLATVRHISNDADSAEQRYQILDTGRDVANNVKSLLVTLHSQTTRNGVNGGVDTKSLLLEASRGVSRALSNLVGICSEMTINDQQQELHDQQQTAAAQAESELLGAASSIEAASLRLAELRPRQSIVQNDQLESMEFDEKILTAAKSITSAVQTLVRAASNAQRELIAQGRLDTSRVSGPDYQWSEGLVSAARFVVAAVHQLCEAANGLVQGQASEEKLISAAKQVASSTAHLLVACNVKADMDSQAKKRLQIAGQAVKNATERLVQSARQIVNRDDRNIVISERLVSGIAQVMDAQEAVLRKEKELGEARNLLAHLHKARYEREGEQQQQQQ